MNIENYKLGWKKELPDFRDIKYKVPFKYFVSLTLPNKVDLRPNMPKVLDQFDIGSCTANAISNCHRFLQMKQNENSFQPSRLFIYYNERKMEGTINEDAGAVIRDGFKTIAKEGVCSEDTWEYDTNKLTYTPNEDSYNEALKHQVIKYERIYQNSKYIKSCLAEGYPIVFGITIFDSFYDDEVSKTGIVKIPSVKESCLGGHAILLVGYDSSKKIFIFQNSWGTTWGDKGYGYLPEDYVTNNGLASDFWTIRLVEINGEYE